MSTAMGLVTVTPRSHSCACVTVVEYCVSVCHIEAAVADFVLFPSVCCSPATLAHPVCNPHSPTVAETRTITWQEKIFSKDDVERYASESACRGGGRREKTSTNILIDS